MNDPLHLQIALDADPAAILDAWTRDLAAWFAEHSDVSIADQRYDFWGRYTPGTPDRQAGRHPLLSHTPNEGFAFGWQFGENAEAGRVDISVHPRDGQQVVVVKQQNASVPEDFWFLSLENLRRHLTGKTAVRCDFTVSPLGDIHQQVDIDASPEQVFGALIEPRQLERWIASRASVETHVGGSYDIGWGNPWKVLELVPNERLTLMEESSKSVITWTLEGSEGKTRLMLVHSGFAPDIETGLYTGWLTFMSSIKALVEVGESWEPPIKRVDPEMLWMYNASVGRRQGELVG